MAVSEASLAKVRSRRKCLKTSKKTKIIAIIAIISLLVIGGVIAAILLLCKFVLHFKYLCIFIILGAIISEVDFLKTLLQFFTIIVRINIFNYGPL